MSLEGKVKATRKLRGKINRLEILRGYSAYEVAVNNGFEGTEEEWLASLRGPKGDPGDSSALKVTITRSLDGGYGADTDPDVIQNAIDDNRTVVCYWYDKNILLYQSSFQRGGPYIFTAIEGAKEYRVVIRDTEDVTCTVTELSGESPSDLDVEWKNILSFTVEEETAEINVPITDVMERIVNATDAYLYFKAARVSSADFIGQSPKGSISIKAGTVSRSILTDAAIAPSQIYESNASTRYSVETSIRFFINGSYKTIDYRIKPANTSESYTFNKGATFNYVAGYSHYLNIKFADSVIGKDSILEIYVPGYQRGE